MTKQTQRALTQGKIMEQANIGGIMELPTGMPERRMAGGSLGLNLIQISERLKGMPIEAVMNFANGSNPEVPPYVALAELNRRKEMEKRMQPSQMPQSTIKDKIEEEMGIGALQEQTLQRMQMEALRQKQMQEQQMQQMAQQPGPAPEGVPQPEVPEEGVASLPVPMELRSGGIVSFRGGGLPPEEGEDTQDGGGSPGSLTRSERAQRVLNQIRGMSEEAQQVGLQQQRQQQKIREQEAINRQERNRLELGPMGAFSGVMRNEPTPFSILETKQPAPAPQLAPARPPAPAQPSAPALQPVSASQPAPAQMPALQPAAPQTAPQAIPYPTPGLAQAGLAALSAGPNKPYPGFNQMYEQAKEKDPYLGRLPGSQLEAYISKLEERDRADEERFKQSQKDRALTGIINSLIAAGEGSRGGGLGGLMAGYGRTAAQELEASQVRAERQNELVRAREMNRIKMMQEIESARIAAAEGRFKDQMAHERNAAQHYQKDREIEAQLAQTLARIEADQQRSQYEVNASNARSFAELEAKAREGNLNRQTEILIAKIREAGANRPGETERIFAEYQRRLRVNPADAEAYMIAIQRAKGLDTRAGDARTRQIAAQIKPKQEELEKLLTNPLTMKEPRVQQLRNEIDALVKQLGGSTEAPLGSSANPIPVR